MSRAVVISGGAPLAVAWECGLVSGLAQSGLSLSTADFFLGTSAGAIVGAQIAAGLDPIKMAEAIMVEATRTPGAASNSPHLMAAIAKLPELFAKAQKSERERIEVGAHALAASTPDDLQTHVGRFSTIVGANNWPETIGIVVVDVADGKARVLRQDCGVTLGTAVAASSSLPGLHPTVPIGGKHYMDGGLRSAANADLVGQFDTVLILSFNPAGPAGERMIFRTAAQVDELLAAGMHVLAVTPDEACLEAIGSDTRNFSSRPNVARSAAMQGARIANKLAEFWR
ncbi:patatin-like phospholipase family protein [Rhizobium jaguaris]|uniref:patatin-like phospholipase family protein n=1 Tax=Rhizobium jaguaris TaxID=1312183 RepID=UPI0039BF6F44